MSLALRLADLISVLGYDHKDHEQRIDVLEAQVQPAKPRVRLIRAATLALANATETTVGFDTETVDDFGFHSNSVNPSRIICPAGQAGLYLVALECWYASNAVAARYTRVYRKSAAGAVLETLSDIRNGSAGGVGTIVRVTGQVVLAVGEYIECTMYQNAGAGVTLTTPASTIFLSLDKVSLP